MTIYIVQWNGPTQNDADSIPRRYADSSYTRAVAKFNEIRKQSWQQDSGIVIGTEEEALTKHVISGQVEVIALINSLK